MKASDRSLATVLFTDIVGSTERASELGDRAWREILARHHAAIRGELRYFGGREVATAGDGFLALFDQPAHAILCADAMRDSVREVGLEIRCGVHMGAIERVAGDVGGIGVHIAARVMAEAEPGEVLVSRTVHDAESGSGFWFEEAGVYELKGVPGQWRLYRVTSVPDHAGTAPAGARRGWGLHRRPAALAGGIAVLALLALTGVYLAQREDGPALTPEEALAADADPGIAVLPFWVNDPDLATWREGMVDLLTVGLDGVPDLRPIASRTVLARWRSEATDAADLAQSLQIARRTGARYALLGSAVVVGGEVRFSADIYDAREGEHLGNAQAQGSPDSVMALVDRLALGVVRALPQGEAGILPRIDLESVTTTSLPAMKSYLEGEALLRRGDLQAAFAAYEGAVKADSTFALALSRLNVVCWWGTSPFECAEYQKRAVQHLDRVPPRTATLMRAYDRVAISLESVDSLRALIRRRPDDAEAWYVLGETYTHAPGAFLIDRREKAVPAFERAIELDPTFAMYYEHLMDFAFNDADSSRATALIEAHGRLAPGSEWDRIYRLASALAFGDSTSRHLALATVDTVETSVLIRAAVNTLWHPSNLPIQTEALAIVRQRPDAEWWTPWMQYRNRYRRGQFDAALAVLDDPATAPYFRRVRLYDLYRSGMDLSPDRLAREFRWADADSTADGAFAHFVAGAYAVDDGRWSDHRAALDHARAETLRRGAAGDTAAARMFDGVARAIEGYALWKRGRAAEALPRLVAVQRDMWGMAGEFGLSEQGLNETVRWWLGRLLLDLGRSRDALVYFRSLDDPFGRFESAKVYHELGDFEEARESYEYALLAWRDADPELRPRIQEARAGLARLPKPLRREGP